MWSGFYVAWLLCGPGSMWPTKRATLKPSERYFLRKIRYVHTRCTYRANCWGRIKADLTIFRVPFLSSFGHVFTKAQKAHAQNLSFEFRIPNFEVYTEKFGIQNLEPANQSLSYIVCLTTDNCLTAFDMTFCVLGALNGQIWGKTP